MYEVVLSDEAEAVFAAADRVLAKKIARCFEQLEQNPKFHPNIKALKGNLAGSYRYRIGDYRVVYEISDAMSMSEGATQLQFKFLDLNFPGSHTPQLAAIGKFIA